MKKVIIYLSILAGFASCSREDIDLSPAEIRPILFSGSVENSSSAVTRAGESVVEDPKPEAMNGTPDYGTIYIRRTAEEKFEKESFIDMDDFQEFMVNVGDLECIKGGCWYWNNPKYHLFHAWNLPTTKGTLDDVAVSGDEKQLVTIDDESHRFGTVDFSMDKRYSYTIKEQGKDPEKIYFLSNLEYFIGAVAGPLTKTSNGGGEYVTLPFKHLVAKIIVKEIRHIKADGSDGTPDTKDIPIPFYMPNMPNKAYWTTGVPAPSSSIDWNSYIPQEPQVTLESPDNSLPSLEAEDYGVSGKLQRGDAFYIFPCKFSEQNKITKQPFGQIQFKLGNAWYYGSLDSITTVKELKAGECISVTLRMKDGTVKGIYPHIENWSDGNREDITQHDRPGIYNETDWQRLIDWLERWKTNNDAPAPPGLLDDEGNLNLYGNLNVSELAEKYSQSDLITEYLQKKGKKLMGNGHRIKMKNSGWNANENVGKFIDELYVSEKTDTGWDTKYYGND